MSICFVSLPSQHVPNHHGTFRPQLSAFSYALERLILGLDFQVSAYESLAAFINFGATGDLQSDSLNLLDHAPSHPLLLALIIRPILCQQIWDVWQTTWDRSNLFTSVGPSSPINFVKPGLVASADIIVSDSTRYQTIVGFGATLTDSSALTLSNLKKTNSGNYWNILQTMFSPQDGADAAGLSYLRVPIGATDFFCQFLDDVNGDASFSNFSMDNAPSYLFSVISDILVPLLTSQMQVHILPWSPPAWMKDSGTMNGGSLKSNLISAYPTYLLKAVQGFKSRGIPVFAISIQNEAENSNPTYPSCTLTPAIEAEIGTALRTLLNKNGLSAVKIIGYEHNWNDAAAYPVQLVILLREAIEHGSIESRLDSRQSQRRSMVSHSTVGYAGSVSEQDSFHSAFPSKNIYFTECSGILGSDWWSDIKVRAFIISPTRLTGEKWYMDNLWIGSLEHYSQSGLMFNLALDGNGNPILPGTNSCPSGCRPLVTINSDGSYSYNQEFYSLAQVSKAIIPKDIGGPWGQRIEVSVGGSLNWALRVGAYATGRVSSSDWTRYSLVVMNWNDNASAGWDPVPVTATIEFRGMQATYTFPVGVTTLWWYAPGTTHFKGGHFRSLNEMILICISGYFCVGRMIVDSHILDVYHIVIVQWVLLIGMERDH
ncbi:Glycoside hydrolase family 30 protein [Mycena sanguinolenta]|uniref:Glycoside hydrolase family 30 protein n=1 Tax=Mycena sanguinolenta TaxID=230812 RepID=A0A8H6YJ96_9AGAR|nr:Glycoside hydrolase family 30 protein [Mycena sanguinolenta]